MKKIKKIAAIFVLIFCIFSFTAFAEGEDESLENLLGQIESSASAKNTIDILKKVPMVNNGCFQALDLAYAKELQEFLKFLDEHFQNKSSTSTLANTAIARFAQYRDRLDAYLNVFNENVGREKPISGENNTIQNKTYELYLNVFSECSELRDEYLTRGKDRMLKHVKSTASQKKTTILLEKQQSINDRLKDLNFDIAKLYAYFQTLANKLPAFTQDLFKSLF